VTPLDAQSQQRVRPQDILDYVHGCSSLAWNLPDLYSADETQTCAKNIEKRVLAMCPDLLKAYVASHSKSSPFSVFEPQRLSVLHNHEHYLQALLRVLWLPRARIEQLEREKRRLLSVNPYALIASGIPTPNKASSRVGTRLAWGSIGVGVPVEDCEAKDRQRNLEMVQCLQELSFRVQRLSQEKDSIQQGGAHMVKERDELLKLRRKYASLEDAYQMLLSENRQYALKQKELNDTLEAVTKLCEDYQLRKASLDDALKMEEQELRLQTETDHKAIEASLTDQLKESEKALKRAEMEGVLLQEHLQSAKAAHHADVQGLLVEHKQNVEWLKEDHLQNTKQLEKEHEERVTRLQAEGRQELVDLADRQHLMEDEIHRRHTEELAKMRDAHQTSQTDTRKEYERQIQALKEELMHMRLFEGLVETYRMRLNDLDEELLQRREQDTAAEVRRENHEGLDRRAGEIAQQRNCRLVAWAFAALNAHRLLWRQRHKLNDKTATEFYCSRLRFGIYRLWRVFSSYRIANRLKLEKFQALRLQRSLRPCLFRLRGYARRRRVKRAIRDRVTEQCQRRMWQPVAATWVAASRAVEEDKEKMALTLHNRILRRKALHALVQAVPRQKQDARAEAFRERLYARSAFRPWRRYTNANKSFRRRLKLLQHMRRMRCLRNHIGEWRSQLFQALPPRKSPGQRTPPLTDPPPTSLTAHGPPPLSNQTPNQTSIPLLGASNIPRSLPSASAFNSESSYPTNTTSSTEKPLFLRKTSASTNKHELSAAINPLLSRHSAITNDGPSRSFEKNRISLASDTQTNLALLSPSIPNPKPYPFISWPTSTLPPSNPFLFRHSTPVPTSNPLLLYGSHTRSTLRPDSKSPTLSSNPNPKPSSTTPSNLPSSECALHPFPCRLPTPNPTSNPRIHSMSRSAKQLESEGVSLNLSLNPFLTHTRPDV